MAFLEDAAAPARDLGVEDMADEAVTQMQNIKPEDLEWVRFTASAAVPTQAYEAYARVFDFSPDWRVGLGEWLATRPPSGSYRDNLRAAGERGQVSRRRPVGSGDRRPRCPVGRSCRAPLRSLFSIHRTARRLGEVTWCMVRT